MTIDHRLVFIDADVLARPVTRTLLIAGSDLSGLAVTWSAYTEAQANKNMRPGAMSVTEVRTRYLHRDVGPRGHNPERFSGTSISDRQVLSDIEAAGAGFLVTADVDDFAEIDLMSLKISAVNPDLFMATRFPLHACMHALKQLVSNMRNPSRGIDEMHSMVAKQHPRLFARHADVFLVPPAQSGHSEPAVLFRGARCIKCGALLRNAKSIRLGIGPNCRNE